MYTHDVIIIGGGAAGLSTASATAQLGLRTALIDKGKLGGDCLYYGCIPSKSIIKSANFYHDLKLSTKFGLPELEIPDINIQDINNRINRIIRTIEPNDSPERFTKLGCNVYLEPAKFIDSHTVELESGQLLSAKKIIISTGSSPKIKNYKGIKETGFITNRDVFSLKQLPESIIAIGAGSISMELSQALIKLGCKVTILTDTVGILPNEDSDISNILLDNIKELGATFKGKVTIESFQTINSNKVVNFLRNGKKESVQAQEILLAIGRSGNTQDLGLENIGVKIENSFIKVDKYLRTSVKNIMAIGDCNGKFLFTHVAGAEASVAIKKIVFNINSSISYNNIPWCTYTKPEIASVGLNELRAKQQNINYQVIETDFKDVDRSQSEGEIIGKIKILIDKKGKILGTQIVGDHAGELILPAIMSIGKKLIVLMNIIYPYPIVSEIYKKAAVSYYGPKLFNNRTRKVLKILFRYGKQ